MHNLNKKIDEIIDRFEFDRVEKTMAALDWKWAAHDRAPTRDEMISQARYMLDVVAHSANEPYSDYISTCGFTAIRMKFPNTKEPKLMLMFCAAQS